MPTQFRQNKENCTFNAISINNFQSTSITGQLGRLGFCGVSFIGGFNPGKFGQSADWNMDPNNMNLSDIRNAVATLYHVLGYAK